MYYRHDVRSTLLVGLRQLDLHPVNTVAAIHEEDEDEDEGNLRMLIWLIRVGQGRGVFYLHAILDFGDNGALGNESEYLAANAEGHGDDKDDEECHLEHEKCKHLKTWLAHCICIDVTTHRACWNLALLLGSVTYKTIVERHDGYWAARSCVV